MRGGLNPRILMIGGAFVLILLLFSITRGRHASSTTKENAGYTKATFSRLDAAETKFRAKHSRYTGNIADLVELDPKLAPGAPALDLRLDASADGKTYVLRVTSDTLTLTRSRTAGRDVGSTCKVLKSGVNCPPGVRKA